MVKGYQGGGILHPPKGVRLFYRVERPLASPPSPTAAEECMGLPTLPCLFASGTTLVSASRAAK